MKKINGLFFLWTLLLLLLITSSSCVSAGVPMCGNGKMEPPMESCDDGNTQSNDGCSKNCQLEDPTGDIWFCQVSNSSTTSTTKTVCCPTLINPFTKQKTCSCEGQASLNIGTLLLPSCIEIDIDECASSSMCHPNAKCKNLDATLRKGGYECICPPGMIGDGKDTCDIFSYQTVLEAAKTQASTEFDTEEFITNLYRLKVVPSWVKRSNINVKAEVRHV